MSQSQHKEKPEVTKLATNATAPSYRRGVVPAPDGTILILTGSTKSIGTRLRRYHEEAK